MEHHLSMRGSERRTAVRSTPEMVFTLFHSHRRAVSSAVVILFSLDVYAHE
jgi:hypothetical protein